jgi:uncharacterized protein (TIGR03435 family)
VVDKTGLNGKYDFELAWTPDVPPSGNTSDSAPPPNPDSPSIFTALREQLGLRLTASKSPVKILVIDQVEKPSGN